VSSGGAPRHGGAVEPPAGGVVVVTDSGACLPPAEASGAGLVVVPLTVTVDGEDHPDGDGVTPQDVAHALRHRRTVSTSRPSPGALASVYRDAAASGAGAVVSVHMSAALSGTYDAAVLAARDAPVPVRVVDSRSLGMGLGFAALAAAERARAGADAEEVAATASARADASGVWFCLDTLEHLRRGGRVGAAQAWLGTALAVKPLLRLDDGRVAPFEKVRTSGRALARLEELVVARAGDDVVDIAVHHLDAVERARGLAERLGDRVPGLRALRVAEVSGAVGAHVGPGLLGVVVSPV
jgi:DegV family protein with EDD domain